jgi:hypothetical protein
MGKESNSRQHMVCRQCGTGLSRTKRPLWMRLIWGSRKHDCDYCAASYMEVFGVLLNLRRGNIRNRTFKTQPSAAHQAKH